LQAGRLVRGSFVAASVAIASLLGAAPASAGPFRINDVSPSLESSVDPASDPAVLNLATQHDQVPATCAQAIAQDQTTVPDQPAPAKPLITPVPSPGADTSETPDASDTSDAQAETILMTSGDGPYLVAGLLNCDGATSTSGDASPETASLLGERSPRLRAAVQALAITASLVLLVWLASLIAAMTRSTRHASSGRRRY